MKSKKYTPTYKASIFVALITGFATLLVAFISSLPSLQSVINSSASPNVSSQEYATLNSEIKNLSTQVKQLNDDIAALQKNPNSSDVSLELSRLNSSVQEIKTKIESLDAIIVNSPEDAISLPLLQKDLENVKIVYDTKINDLEKSVNNAYIIVVGVLVVIGLGFLGVAATSYLSNRTTKDDDQSNNNYELGKLGANLDELRQRVVAIGSVEEKISKLSTKNQELYDELTQLRNEIAEVGNTNEKNNLPPSTNKDTGETKS